VYQRVEIPCRNVRLGIRFLMLLGTVHVPGALIRNTDCGMFDLDVFDLNYIRKTKI